ncbi:MAG: hypothetical protein AAF762_00495 [Pseudomonadota bacterium]
MSFVRPEVSAGLWRWREVVAGVAAVCLGAVVATGRIGFLGALGWVIVFVGFALIVSGVSRGRFRNAGGGRGVVEVDERAVRYLGPEIGGAVALGQISRIAVALPHAWELTDAAGQRLTIPVDAEGAEALFDAFISLPGMTSATLAEAAAEPPESRRVIWERPHGSES